MKSPKIPKIYKMTEFEEFIRTLEEGSVEHWIEIARAVGVDKDTITAWNKQPQAIEARKKGIRYALEQMEKSGRRDWKMWKEKLALLDVQATDKKDITSDGEKLEGLQIVIVEDKQNE
jgi:hypothetical protein